MCYIKTAFKEDLRYAVRWMIIINALGLGAVLVCGEAIAKLLYKTSGNNSDDLHWLATQIGQCYTIDFRAVYITTQLNSRQVRAVILHCPPDFDLVSTRS
ncbi:hypothetical protein B0J14DRAFT_651095 [Halenospora varia]|nr:hypothetical protein B0J14DRAFT_651095 [Halenospora varia]